MYKKLKVLALVALTALLLMPAQMPLGAQESNMSFATAGVFGTAVDDFMSVNYFSDMEFDKWWGFAGAQITGDGNNRQVHLGYARNFGELYLGAYFNGNFVNITKDKYTMFEITYDFDRQKEISSTETRDDNNPSFPWAELDPDGNPTWRQEVTHINNELAFLIGIGTMGIKVGYSHDTFHFGEPKGDRIHTIVTDNDEGTVTYTNEQIDYSKIEGYMNPYVQWGMSLPVGEMTLLPRAVLGLNFYRDNSIDNWQTRTTVFGQTIGAVTINRNGHASNYLGLQFGAGADLALNPTATFMMDYYGSIRLYNNDMGDSGKSGKVKGTARWDASALTTSRYEDRTVVVNNVPYNVTEMSFHDHAIIPGFRKEFGFEALKLGFVLKSPVYMSFENSDSTPGTWISSTTTYNDSYNFHRNTATITDTKDENTVINSTELIIAPTLGLGASYEVVPGRITLNTGVLVTPVTYKNQTSKSMTRNFSTTRTTTTTNGVVTSDTFTTTAGSEFTVTEYIETVSALDGLSGALSAGFMFSFNEAASLDFAINARTEDNWFNLDLTNVNLLLTLKF